MSIWVEPLESRTLFDATVLTVPQAYASEGASSLALRFSVEGVHTDRLKDGNALAADVRALGNGKGNVGLLRKTLAAARAAEVSVGRATNLYALGTEKRFALVSEYNALFDAHPSVKANLRLQAAQDRVRLVAVPRLAALTAAVTKGASAVSTALAAFAAANTAAASAGLLADIQSATADQVDITAQAESQIATAQIALASLDGTATAPDPTDTATT